VITTCPRCSFEIPEKAQGAPDCPGCGVIFARYDPEKASMARLEAVRSERSPEPSRPPVLPIGLALAVTLAVFAMLAIRSTRPEQPDDLTSPGSESPGVSDVAEAVDGADAGGSDPETLEERPPGLTASQFLASGLEEYGDLDPDRDKPAVAAWQLREIRHAIEAEPGLDFSVEEPIPAGVPVVLEPGPLAELQWIGWYEGADGYTQALQQAHRMNRPLVIYFHTEWCNFCRAMNKDFLPDPLVRRFLSNVMRVHVNPELSSDGEALATRFGVAGYPSFFVLPSGADIAGAKRVHPFRNGQAITPQEFVAECEEAANES
jgi:thiol-disulfide isomerase/thioredoxin